MDKKILVVLLIALSIFISGCTLDQSNICGDLICSAGEENTCPTDCLETIEGVVTVNVGGGWDTEGDIYLEYYTSTDVYQDLSSRTSSYVSSAWMGETTNRLSISLNENQRVEKIVPSDSRTVKIENLKQGEYYFTVRSGDYQYSSEGETLVISEDKDYQLNLDLKPSKPAVRIRTVDQDYNPVNGPGEIKIYEVVEYYDQYGSGNYEEEKYEVASTYFSDSDEMNALFWLWTPRRDEYSSSRFVAEVLRNKEIVSELYIYPHNSYNEYTAYIPNEIKYGSIKLVLTPGEGTTENDLVFLEGELVRVSGGPIKERVYEDIEINDGMIILSDLPTGSYSVYQNYYDSQNSDKNIATPYVDYYNFELKEGVNEELEITATLGIYIEIGLLDSTETLVDPSRINIHDYCILNMNYETNELYMDCPEEITLCPTGAGCNTYTLGVDNFTWEDGFGDNPIKNSMPYYSQPNPPELENYDGPFITLSVSLDDGDVEQFDVPLPEQGNNINYHVFEPILVCTDGLTKCVENGVAGCVDTSNSIYDCGGCNIGCDPGEFCEQGQCTYYPDSEINVFDSEAAGETVIGEEAWIRMSIGYENDDAAMEAYEEDNVELQVLLNEEMMAQTLPNEIEYNEGAELWEINAYYYVEKLKESEYTLEGRTYVNGDLIGSAKSILLNENGGTEFATGKVYATETPPCPSSSNACSNGIIYLGQSGNFGKPAKYPFTNAAYCDQLDYRGHTDWRLVKDKAEADELYNYSWNSGISPTPINQGWCYAQDGTHFRMDGQYEATNNFGESPRCTICVRDIE